jgi:hypothetical protein
MPYQPQPCGHEAASGTSDQEKGTQMSTDSKIPVEALDKSARFYVIFSELAKAEEERDVTNIFSDELSDIEQVMQMVVDVNDEPAQFATST